MKTVITSFTSLVTAEGNNIAFTYSVIDENGTKVKENVKKSLILVDADVEQKVNDIKDFLLLKVGE